MKIIFLDVDGVLNDAFTRDRAPGGFIGINPTMVEQLKRIIDETNAFVVLTSTWKDDWDPTGSNSTKDGKYLETILNEHGVGIFDKTQDRIFNRGEGIHNYLENRKDVKSWIAIDDDVFTDYEKYNIMPHLIKTNFGYGGLTSALADEAIKRLNADAD